jgi:hypothetical protein
MLLISFIIIFTLKKKGDALKNRYAKKECEADWFDKYTKKVNKTLVVSDSNYAEWYKFAED